MKRMTVMLGLLIGGCTGIPDNVTPIEGFDLNRYLGTWYEAARLDHSFERGLSNVTAQYSLRDDGGVRVVNRGYNAEKKEWKEAVGKAFFVDEPTKGHLKVSFFGPFYGSYVIMDLDRDQYQYALVCGPSRSYLWILSRTPTLDESVKSRLLKKAADLGFDTKSLIWVEHTS
jgi:apolipoprotein D and lipocalin family protein